MADKIKEIGEKVKINNPTKSKASEKAENVIVTYSKPDPDKFGASQKIARMRVIFTFVSKMMKAKMHEDDSVIQMIAPYTPCDAPWFKENVFRYVDIDNSGRDEVTLAKADKLVATYHMKDPDGTHQCGVGLIQSYANEMYQKLSIWRFESDE